MEEHSESVRANSSTAVGKRWSLVLGLGVMCLAAMLYSRVWDFGFSILDDSQYVLANPNLAAGLSAATLKRVFIPSVGLYWSPLTQLSLMLDTHFFGVWAGGYHLMNLLWHCANVGLLFLLVLRLGGSRLAATFAAALFAAHPAHIEAVAWITARKDLVSTFFGLSAINIYISWARRPSGKLNVLVHAAFIASLLGKPMFVTMAGLLLLLDWWPLGRLTQPGGVMPDLGLVFARVREKTLMLSLAAAITLVTLRSHFAGAFDRLDPSLGLKLANAVVSYAKYLGLLVWPHDQAIVYPFPDTVPAMHVVLSGLLLAAITWACLRQMRARPYLLVGWLWFLAALMPVIIPPKVGLHVEYADRWSYVPFMGLYLALGCLGAELAQRVREGGGRVAVSAALVAVPVVALAPVQQRQLETWRMPLAQAEQAFRVTRNNYLLLNNYAILKVRSGDNAAAERAFKECLEIFPEYSPAMYNLALLFIEQKRYDEALATLLRCVEVDIRRNVKAYDSYCALGLCLTFMGQLDKAQHYYALAIQENPSRPRAYNDWGNLARQKRDYELARELYRRALAADPSYELAQRNLVKLENLMESKPLPSARQE